MGKQFPSIDASHSDFIARQRIFFAASAAPGARVNVSPRGTDAFAVIDEHTVAYLDRTGSGAETAAHLRADGRLTIMFCAFDGPPNILRLYGQGEALRRAPGLTPNCSRAPSAARSRPARGRSSACMSIWSRRRAAMGRRSSTIAASAPRSTTGPAQRAKTALRPTGGRRTWSASTACRPASSTRPEGPRRRSSFSGGRQRPARVRVSLRRPA
jgi:Pyridoxamine 5'-phosphate oxidase